jgi:hypothetical protein
MEHSPFNKLSKELRDMIYRYTLPDPVHVVDISPRGQTPEVVITQLCRQMRDEAHQASTEPYKLCIGEPPDLAQEIGNQMPLPTHFDLLLKRGATNFYRTPLLFRSKPTTIELRVAVRTDLDPADDLRNSYTPPGQTRRIFKTYGAPWNFLKDSV